MRNTIHTWALVGGCCASLLANDCLGQGKGFYLEANAGPTLAEDVKLKEFLVPLSGVELELDPGSRFSVGGGYNFNEFVSIGAETGFIYNEVDEVGRGGDFDGSLSHVPFMVNVTLRCDRQESRWIPYVSAAAGGNSSIIVVDDVRAPNGRLVDGDDASFVFAWQAAAGVRYRLNPNMSLGAGYKFFWADGATWDVSNSAGDIETGHAEVHSVGVDFRLTF